MRITAKVGPMYSWLSVLTNVNVVFWFMNVGRFVIGMNMVCFDNACSELYIRPDFVHGLVPVWNDDFLLLC